MYTSEAWSLLSAHLHEEIGKAHLSLEANIDERKADRVRGRIAFARQLLQDAQPRAILPAPPPVDY